VTSREREEPKDASEGRLLAQLDISVFSYIFNSWSDRVLLQEKKELGM